MKKRIITAAFALLLTLAMAVPAFAGVAIDKSDYLYDGADLLTDDEEKEISARLTNLSSTYSVHFIVATVDSVGELTLDDSALSYFEDTLGLTDSDDAVMLYITMEDEDKDRAYRIYTTGLAKEAITESDQLSIGDNAATFLSENYYYDAIDSFLYDCEYYIDGYINGYPFPFFMSLVISLAVGFVIALIITGVWRGQLKSVSAQKGAATYIKKGSMNLTTERDLYLYKTITRQKKETKSQSSSTRSTSGGGRMTGGKF